MRDKIRLPADVEFLTKFINEDTELPADAAFKVTIETQPNGRFNKVTKVTVELTGVGEVIVITPKEHRTVRQYQQVTPFVPAVVVGRVVLPTNGESNDNKVGTP